MNFYLFLIFSLSLSLFLFVIPINSWQFGDNEHKTITQEALPFLKSEILEQIVKGNHDEDDGIPDEAVAANHFDACQFYESVNNINEKYHSLREMSKPSSNPSLAAWQFGELLHPVQDFYSHSNWVELEKDHIIENGLGYWPAFVGWTFPNSNDQDVLIVQDDLPDGWSMTSDIVPEIRSPSFEEPKKGLFTHGRDEQKLGQFFDDCPDELEYWFHDRLNKDDPNPVNKKGTYSGDLSKYPDLHIKAKSLAVKQTTHEWCRLLEMINLHHGLSSVNQIFTNWVADPISAVSVCPVSDITKSIIPDAVDTDGDGIPDSTSGDSQLPEPSAYTTTTTDAGATPKATKPLYQSQQFNCDPKSATLQVPAKGNKVIELQTYLTDLGYGDLLDPEKIDGKFGPHTKNSVMAYQKDFGLSVDGKVGPQTWGSLCEQISLLPTTFPSGAATTATTTDDTSSVADDTSSVADDTSSVADEIQMDTNGDGVVDELDTQTTTAETTTPTEDTNGDGVVDELDTQTTTAETTTPTEDTNGDGVVDELDTQTTTAETTTPTEDTNGDGVVDALDEAAETETATTTTTDDTSSVADDTSSVADEIQMDTNGDGVVDELDTQTTTAETTTPTEDTNGDGVVDALDEAAETETATTTTTDDTSSVADDTSSVADDTSSVADEIQMDTNGDGVVDELDTQTTTAETTTPTEDTNGDGVVDELDTQTTTAETTTPTEDTNGDGVVDELDTQTTTAETTTPTEDTNGDGVVDALDEAAETETATTTTTDDTSSAADEIQMDTNGDGVVDATSSGDDQLLESGSDPITSLE